MKKRIAALVLSCSMLVGLTGCASWNRNWKSFTSDISGGLDRTVIVYSYTGEEICRYTGKIDIEQNDSKVLFDVNGKRVSLYNCVVVVEEDGVE